MVYLERTVSELCIWLFSTVWIFYEVKGYGGSKYSKKWKIAYILVNFIAAALSFFMKSIIFIIPNRFYYFVDKGFDQKTRNWPNYPLGAITGVFDHDFHGKHENYTLILFSHFWTHYCKMLKTLRYWTVLKKP